MGLIINGIDITQGKQGKSAYDIAVEHGYTGTLQDFGDELIKAVESQMLFGRFNTNITWNTNMTVYTQIWTYDGAEYKSICIEENENKYVQKLYINDVLHGTWTMTITDTGASTVYTSA